MKKFKVLIAAVLLCSICLSLCACSIDKEEVLGTWSAVYVHNGNSIAVTFTLSEDGNYHYVLFKNGLLNTVEDGTYDIKGSKVNLHPDGNEGISRVYKSKGDTLVNGDHAFTKSELDLSQFGY